MSVSTVSATSVSALAVTLFIKSSLLVIAVSIVARYARRRGSTRPAGRWPLLFLALAGLPLATAFLPRWSFGSLNVRHDVLEQSLTSGSINVSLATLATAVWLAGVLYLLGRLLLDWRAGLECVNRATPTDDPRIQGVVERAATSLGLSQSVGLRLSSDIASPAVFGWRRPIVLLPDEAVTWPEAQLCGVMCHELAHIRSRDWLTHAFELLTSAIYWPNPFVHLAHRRAALDRELAADRAALRAGVAPDAFAVRIIEVARACTRGSMVGAVAFASQAGLDERVRALFASADESPPTPERNRAASLVWVLPLFLLTAAAEPLLCIPGVPPVSASRCP